MHDIAPQSPLPLPAPLAVKNGSSESAIRPLTASTAVLESTEPGETLALCNRYRGRVDLLITDYVMPRMNGHELAARVVAAHPETRVLYMSGYAKLRSRPLSEVWVSVTLCF